MLGPFLAAVMAITDGDTFKARIEVWPGVEISTAVRVMGIDTPELHGKCQDEKTKALAAKDRLTALLAAGPVSLAQVKFDKFGGRIDAIVLVGGKDVGQQLVAEGLAHPYNGGVKLPWCP